MASHFSANQYEDAFKSVKLQNWQSSMTTKERPKTQEGFTQIISNDRGHLMPGVSRSQKSPWDTGYVNAWAMPHKIPGNCISVKTARSTYAQEKLQHDYEDAEKTLTGRKPRQCTEKGSEEERKPATPEATRFTTPPCDACRTGAKAPTPEPAPAPATPQYEGRWSVTPPWNPQDATQQEQQGDCTNRSLVAV